MAWTSSQKSLSARVKNKEQTKHKMKTIKTLAIGLAAFALVAFSPSSVRASLYDFSYFDTATGGTIVQASGTLTTTGPLTLLTGYQVGGLSGYDIIAVTGLRNGSAITIQPNPAFPGTSTSPNNYYDNALVVNPNGSFDVDGLNFYSADGFIYNLSTGNIPIGGLYYDTISTAQVAGTPVTLTLTQVPEPTTMIAGALLLLPFGASTLRILRKRTA